MHRPGRRLCPRCDVQLSSVVCSSSAIQHRRRGRSSVFRPRQCANRPSRTWSAVSWSLFALVFALMTNRHCNGCNDRRDLGRRHRAAGQPVTSPLSKSRARRTGRGKNSLNSEFIGAASGDVGGRSIAPIDEKFIREDCYVAFTVSVRRRHASLDNSLRLLST